MSDLVGVRTIHPAMAPPIPDVDAPDAARVGSHGNQVSGAVAVEVGDSHRIVGQSVRKARGSLERSVALAMKNPECPVEVQDSRVRLSVAVEVTRTEHVYIRYRRID